MEDSVKIEIDLYDADATRLVIALLQQRLERHEAELREREAAEARFRQGIGQQGSLLGAARAQLVTVPGKE
jgi:uncharacterized small protein (DUF1192 family)